MVTSIIIPCFVKLFTMNNFIHGPRFSEYVAASALQTLNA